MSVIAQRIKTLVNIMSVDGFEHRNIKIIQDFVKQETADFFDDGKILPCGSLLFCHKNDGKKKIVLDAHIDTVGFVVSDMAKGGFVKVTNLGGINPYTLPTSHVKLYGKQIVDGFFTSVPPHLKKDDKTEIEVESLYVDTGLSEQEKTGILSVGTPVGFAEQPLVTTRDRIISHSLDDKACAVMLLEAMDSVRQNGTDAEVYLHLSVGEEKTGRGGKTLPYVLDADACIVTDVNFAAFAGVPRYESYVIGDGCGVSYSVTTSRKLTDYIVHTAEKNGMKLHTLVETLNTGSNANYIHRHGIPCAVFSLPLANMHTESECVSAADIASGGAILAKTLQHMDERAKEWEMAQ